MMSELDELAKRAANDLSLSRTGLDRVIVSVIRRTQRHWATTRYAPPEGVRTHGNTTDEGMNCPES